VKSSKNLPAATKFLVWLTETKAQEIFADANLEYPANPQAKSNPLVDSWGPFSPSKMQLGKSGELQAEAVMLMDRSGYK
jgi:iron(III) transport system substrate-binding protein